jgi:hypothetical protein
VTNTFDSLPSDLVGAHALILAERAARLSSEERASQAEADLTHAQATASSADARERQGDGPEGAAGRVNGA